MSIRSFFSRQSSASSRNGGTSESLPPSYRSPGYTASDTPSGRSGRSAAGAGGSNGNPGTSRHETRRRSSRSSRASTSANSIAESTGSSYSVASSATVTGASPYGAPGSSNVRLLTMYYQKESVLTQCVDRYEEVERSARVLFRIDKDELVFIEANISALQGKRMRIDPRIWAAVNDGIAEVWISTPAAKPKPLRGITLFEIDDYSFEPVNVHENGTIQDLKAALVYSDPRLAIEKILIWHYRDNVYLKHYARGNALRDEEPIVYDKYSYSARR